MANELRALQDEYILTHFKEGCVYGLSVPHLHECLHCRGKSFSAWLLMFLLPRVPEASKQMNQSWGQLVMFDSLYTQVNDHVEAAASLLAGGLNKPVTVDMKRHVRKEHIDQTWENALITNKMSKAADKSRRAAAEAQRNAAVGIIQVP